MRSFESWCSRGAVRGGRFESGKNEVAAGEANLTSAVLEQYRGGSSEGWGDDSDGVGDPWSENEEELSSSAARKDPDPLEDVGYSLDKARQLRDEEYRRYQVKMAKKQDRQKWKVPHPTYFKVSMSDDEYSDYEPSESHSEESEDSEYDADAESGIETAKEGYLGCPEWREDPGEDVHDTLRREAKSMGFAHEGVLGDFWDLAWDLEKQPADEFLLAKLVPRLVNVKTMFLMPISDIWEHVQGDDPLIEMIAASLKEGAEPVLQKLETLYIASSLCKFLSNVDYGKEVYLHTADLGAKGDCEYDLPLDQILPFLQLPALRTLKALTPFTTCYDANFAIPEPSFEFDVSNLTSLTLDECNLEVHDTLTLLNVPRSLSHFRWDQDLEANDSDHGLFFCLSPFYDEIGHALAKHKSTLTELDLDIRRDVCDRLGHRGNPFASSEQLRGDYRDKIIAEYIRAPQDAVLIGSLRDYAVLQTLSIDVAALCGHQSWAPSPLALVDVLPPQLLVLNLRVKLESVKGRVVLENVLWMEQVVDLLRRRERAHLRLRELRILISRKKCGWEKEKPWVGKEADEDWLWVELRKECEAAGVRFGVENEEGGPKEAWFKEVKEKREPADSF